MFSPQRKTMKVTCHVIWVLLLGLCLNASSLTAQDDLIQGLDQINLYDKWLVMLKGGIGISSTGGIYPSSSNIRGFYEDGVINNLYLGIEKLVYENIAIEGGFCYRRMSQVFSILAYNNDKQEYYSPKDKLAPTVDSEFLSDAVGLSLAGKIYLGQKKAHQFNIYFGLGIQSLFNFNVQAVIHDSLRIKPLRYSIKDYTDVVDALLFISGGFSYPLGVLEITFESRLYIGLTPRPVGLTSLLEKGFQPLWVDYIEDKAVEPGFDEINLDLSLGVGYNF